MLQQGLFGTVCRMTTLQVLGALHGQKMRMKIMRAWEWKMKSKGKSSSRGGWCRSSATVEWEGVV